MIIKWQEANLSEVLSWFVKDFELEPGQKLVSHEEFVDISKGKVMFKLVLKDKDEK